MREITVTDVRAVPGDSAFLLDDGKTAVLYDTGFAFTGFQVAENVRKALGDRPLDYILLTHSHYDHALGSAYVAKLFPDVKIVAGAYAAGIFAKPSARAVMRELNRKAARQYGVQEFEDLIDELRVDIPVRDGDILTCGDLRIQVLELPGHTKCSVGYYLPEEKLLLSVETLGVYFGGDTYLPSCLVGYQMALDSFAKVRKLNIERMLLPHYGIVNREAAWNYIGRSEKATVDSAKTIVKLLRLGKTKEEIIAHLTETEYREEVRPVYPIDAYTLNTGIMIDLIGKELLD